MKNQKGITLVELIIVVALATVVSAAAFSILIFGNRSFSQQRDRAASISSARHSVDFITRQIRKAGAVSVTGNVITVEAGNVITADSNKIVLESNALKMVTPTDTTTIAENVDTFLVSQTGSRIAIELQVDSYTIASDVHVR